MLKANFKPYILKFITPGGTSRGVLHTKKTYFIKIWDSEKPHIFGIGEAAIFENLSADDRPDYEKKLDWVCKNIHDLHYQTELKAWPSILFGVEIALADLKNGGAANFLDSEFQNDQNGIKINGLIWMGTPEYMNAQIEQKLEQGFDCLKMKIGAIDFQAELNILNNIRKRFSAKDLELRVDANGAFSQDKALLKLNLLSKYNIHSIEQPIKAKQWNKMYDLCRKTPIPIALDEELIGVFQKADKIELLDSIKPQYIILKPSLHGGFSGADEWIKFAEERNIQWWATSALESNIGLNAIAQWVYPYHSEMPQGLGTGQVFSNNIDSPLEVKNGKLVYSKQKQWNISAIETLF